MQLLLRRAEDYYAVACLYIHAALDGLQEQKEATCKRPPAKSRGYNDNGEL
jgi:hypothetical protein